ncbi:nucleolar protein 6 isoform X1 [Hyalella azteca]|uniref:Nucleolar protein 6 n=1 Tax=Hyalella azteca TaxID=294128 RepID=A0A8B7PQX2_HYAAZ|nr:nucleolar protein 6 isoform X2 [Hyalella azteca]XP_047738177.1 nucleolar protein 6 isoform X1 [Hyalella azteca]
MAKAPVDEFDGEGTQYNGNASRPLHRTKSTGATKRTFIHQEEDGPLAKHQRIVEDLPSTQELIFMKETKALYNNSLFRIQLETLLSEVTIKAKHKVILDQWISKFSEYLLALPTASEAVPFSDWSSYSNEGVTAPLPWLPGVQGTFEFVPPAGVACTGSYADGTITTLSKVIDLKVEVPQHCIEAGDHRDGRWLLKRAHYLAHIAKSLKSCSLVAQMHWSRHLDEPLRPVLLITPKLTGGAGKWQIRLLPVPADSAFKVHAFSPQKLNIKTKGNVSCSGINFLCGIDLALASNNSLLQSTLPAMPGLLQAVKLVKVWLRQRHLNEGRGSMSGHVVSMLVLFLYRLRRINAQMSAYQVFRVLLNYLEHECNWDKTGVSLYELNKNSAPANPFANTVLPVAGHHLHYKVVFVDPSGYLNLTSTVSPHILSQIQQEAKLGLTVLSSDSRESFESLFIQRTDFHLTFDQSLFIRISKETLTHFYSSANSSTAGHLVNQLHPSLFSPPSNTDDENATVGEMHPIIDGVIVVLEKGLTGRARLIAPQLVTYEAWDVDENPPEDPEFMLLGLRLDPAVAFSLLIKDVADDPAAFRDLWGELSSLRRFRDGTACEAVAFGDGSEGAGDCRRIPGKIAKHLLSRHLQIPRCDVFQVGPKLENVLRLPTAIDEHVRYSTGETLCMQAEQAYDELCSQVRTLDVNLSVTGFASSAPVLAQCEVFPRPRVDPQLPKSKAFKLAETPDPIEVFVSLERSGKWPEDLERVNVMKRGFHCHMMKQLLKKGFTATLTASHLLVAIRGWVFAVQVTYQGEVALLRQVGADEGEQEDDEDDSLKDTPASVARQIATTVAPRIVSALSGLGGEYSSYSGTVRLCRRWLSCHLLEPHVPCLVTQLLVAQLYLNPGQFDVPHTPAVGLLRFLALLANTNFLTTPFFLSVGENFHAVDMSELQLRFNNQRSTLPPLFLVTPYDVRGSLAKLEADGIENVSRSTLEFRYGLVSHCSRESPNAHVLALAKLLATQSLSSYTDNCANPAFDCASLFQPSLSYFDMVIRLNPEHIYRYEENLNFDVKKVKLMRMTCEDQTQTICKPRSPAEVNIYTTLLQVLKDRIGSIALIFHDAYGGDIIGVCFKPGSLEEKPCPRILWQQEYELVSKERGGSVQYDPHVLASSLKMSFSPLIASIEIKNSRV